MTKYELPYPLTFETENLDGQWILVNVLAYVGCNKWEAIDEDGDKLTVDGRHLRCPDWSGFDNLPSDADTLGGFGGE
jgi:hypothetical protein